MDEWIHRRVGEVALERGFLDAPVLSEAMLVLGRMEADGGAPGLRVWVERSWLDGAQLAEVVSQLGIPITDRSQGASGIMRAEELEKFVRAETAFLQSEDARAGEAFARGDTALAPAQPDEPDVDDPPTIPFELSDATVAEDSHASDPFDSQMNTLVHRDESEATARHPSTQDSFGGERQTTDVENFGQSQPPADHASVAIDRELLDPGERFVLGDELGRGGGGRVVRVFDRVLGRTIAMKILPPALQGDADARTRFIAEAQATGQLEHPNIVPVYDFGVLPSGEFYYTMREVVGRSLREVFHCKARNDAAAQEEFTVVRLLSILRQVCQAVHYAHTRGVIHRDLKPDNIMLGDYGEVLVMDWGLARVLDNEVRTDLSRQGGEQHRDGETFGTPAYMPPEQARGELDAVDELSDVYSLGAILYEILTLQPPFVGNSAEAVMVQVAAGRLDPPSQRAASGQVVPDELERLCLEAMALDKRERPASAGEMSDRLEEWIEGIQPREARRCVKRGDAATERYRDLVAEAGEYKERVAEMAARVEPFEPIDHKRALWRLEDRRDEIRADAARAFGDAVTGYTQALAHQPDNSAAKAGLAALYFERYEQAERRRDRLDSIYFGALVRQYDMGNYAALLAQKGRLTVDTEPSKASVTLFGVEEIDRRLVAGDATELGQTPLEVDDLDVGSYLLVLDHDKREALRVPLRLERGRSERVHVRLPRRTDLEEGFVYVPGGEFITGGDPQSFDPRAPSRVHVDSFFCARFPVTFRDYLEWINELNRDDPDEAMARAPQTRDADGMLVRFDDVREVWVPDEILIEGAARELYPAGHGHEYDLPVVGIRAADAEAYCAWRAQRDGRAYRLPTRDELEKAGRGVDGRFFPWGNRFDATFCKMRFSRAEMSQLEPVGVFVDDVSPYGVRDLAGGVRDWCQADHPDDDERPIFGGAWLADEQGCRLASRLTLLTEGRTSGIGFRLVYSA